MKLLSEKSLSRVRLFATPWTVAHQAPLSMKFSRQEYWSGLPFSRGSSRPRDQTCVSYIRQILQGSNPGLLHCTKVFFTIWATKEAPWNYMNLYKISLRSIEKKSHYSNVLLIILFNFNSIYSVLTSVLTHKRLKNQISVPEKNSCYPNLTGNYSHWVSHYLI